MEELNLPELEYKRENKQDGKKYTIKVRAVYCDPRYKKSIIIPNNYRSDGSTCGVDIYSWYWVVHDYICEYGTWSDGTPVSNWQASRVLSRILRLEYTWKDKNYWIEARPLRAKFSFLVTFLFGGRKLKKF